MAGRYPITWDQGTTLVRSFRVTSKRANVVAVTNVVEPLIRTDRPHGLAVGVEVCLAGVKGAVGVNNTPIVPVWVVAAVPSATSFTIATDAPGEFEDPTRAGASGGAVAVPRSLVGYSARMHVRPDISSDTLTLDASPSFAIVAPAGSAVVHQVVLTVAATVGVALAPDTYRYDLELESPAAVVERIAEGPLTLRPETTR